MASSPIQIISLGTAGTQSGDTIRQAFDKCNDNFAVVDQRGLGWHGNQTRIKLIPSHFLPNDDQSYYNVAVVDNGGQLKVTSSSLKMYAFVPIPKGYKATHVRVYGTTGLTVEIYECTVNGNAATLKGSGVTSGNDISLASGSGVVSTALNYLAIKIITTSTLDRIYGGYVTIEESV